MADWETCEGDDAEMLERKVTCRMPLPRTSNEIMNALNHCKSVQVSIVQMLSFDRDEMRLVLDETVLSNHHCHHPSLSHHHCHHQSLSPPQVSLHGIPMAEAYSITTKCAVTEDDTQSIMEVNAAMTYLTPI